MTNVHFSNLNGAATWLYNYNVIPMSQAEVDYMNSNNMEFVPMFGGAYAQTQYSNTIAGWPLEQGGDARCYLWEEAIPTGINNIYKDSSVCTVEQLVELVNASNSVLSRPIERIAMFNEPWASAAYPENHTKAARFYKDMLEPLVEALGLSVISATTQATNRALEWDTSFLKDCMGYGCNLGLIKEWSIHEYKTKYSSFTTKYQAFSGTFYSLREAEFASGYGVWTSSQWRDFFRAPKLLFTEHSAEQETATSFGPPDNSGTCLRMSGQFGNSGLCSSFGNDNAACSWGDGTLNWMLETDRTNVAGVVIWPTYYHPSSNNQAGGRSSRLVYEDGSLTPNGRAFLAIPGDGLAVDCTDQKSPSPPPPAPPLLPPSPPVPPSPPTPPPIRPPLPPLECSAMNGRFNTQNAFETPKFCYEIKTTNELGCDAYYSLGGNSKMRLCFNPIYPTTSSNTNCDATSDFVYCDPLPPSPPPPQAPASGRRMQEAHRRRSLIGRLLSNAAAVPEMREELKGTFLHNKYTYTDDRM
jgi:hypothetical protein